MTVLEGRHALVTGAGRGIGAAIAQRLAADGARVTLMGRSRASLDAVGLTLGHRLGDIVICDVTDSVAVASAVAAIPPVDVLVNNAGQAESAPLTRTSDELWARMLAVNLTGPFHMSRAVLPGMIKTGWGRIVTVASTASLRGYPYVSAYVAAKHGALGLTRALALEVATRGITVNAVCPGFTDTDMLQESVATIVARTGRSESDARATLAALNPQGRFISPGDVANAVAWLCAPGADAITGVALPVSGGEV
ncbi:MAG TPA: KR domain-containing protein [Gemmatimonas aurantiaca]|uniref:KR domain-containing protein n=2 Tax=Gemmatimonas aurantiaca TaxID=173480 RepID=A0A3D4V978_9BACT|nr:KR domain-containing protein [Gemmatimonas aurantiaca]